MSCIAAIFARHYALFYSLSIRGQKRAKISLKREDLRGTTQRKKKVHNPHINSRETELSVCVGGGAPHKLEKSSIMERGRREKGGTILPLFPSSSKVQFFVPVMGPTLHFWWPLKSSKVEGGGREKCTSLLLLLLSWENIFLDVSRSTLERDKKTFWSAYERDSLPLSSRVAPIAFFLG